MIKLIWWRLRLLDAPQHQWTRMRACKTAVCFGMVDLSLDGDVLCTAEKTRQWSNARRLLVCPLRVGSLQTFDCPIRGGYLVSYYSNETPPIEQLGSREAC